jgi:hypothetical protein
LGALDAVRPAVYALTLLVLGLQFVFASFFLSLFQIRMHVLPPRPRSAAPASDAVATGADADYLQ